MSLTTNKRVTTYSFYAVSAFGLVALYRLEVEEMYLLNTICCKIEDKTTVYFKNYATVTEILEKLNAISKDKHDDNLSSIDIYVGIINSYKEKE